MSAWIAQTFGSVEALAQVTLAALVGGVVGVHVVLRRLPFLVMGLTHATFPGLVIAGLRPGQRVQRQAIAHRRITGDQVQTLVAQEPGACHPLGSG